MSMYAVYCPVPDRGSINGRNVILVDAVSSGAALAEASALAGGNTVMEGWAVALLSDLCTANGNSIQIEGRMILAPGLAGAYAGRGV